MPGKSPAGLQKDRGDTMKKILLAVFLAAAMLLTAGCGVIDVILGREPEEPLLQPTVQPSSQSAAQPGETPLETSSVQPTQEPAEIVPSGEGVILFTGDVHCAIEKGFGYAGLQEMRDYLLSQGDEVVLVDTGDAIQGEPVGTMSKGEAIVDLMNAAGYDIAVPGCHEFDYGVDRFLALAEQADYTYVSCNFNKDGEPLLTPYVTKSIAGHLVSFIGVTTPRALTASSPRTFMNDEGKYVYGFYQDDYGRYLYNAVQRYVNSARVEGAEYVVLLAHLGNKDEFRPWRCSDIISNTTGISLVIDGQSHDTEQTTFKNKDGEDVIRVGCGSKLDSIGYVRIDAEGELSVGRYSWDNEVPAPAMMGIRNEMSAAVAEAKENLSMQLGEVFAATSVELTNSDPIAVDNSGTPIRMIRCAETNLGDFCADAYRIQSGADIAMISGGDIAASIPAGDITLNDILRVLPNSRSLCVVEVSGQTILDALEWASQYAPEENYHFMQVSGLSYEIHTYIEETCWTDDDENFRGVYGARRVRNVMVNGEPIQWYSTYTLACNDSILLDGVDGFAMFANAKVVQERTKLDYQALIDYITENLGGFVDDEYANPFGHNRIVLIESAP